MTIAVSLKVHDGVVLAADSASTLQGRTADGATSVLNVYGNANKIFNLRKGLPIGAITWGSGAIGASSISTLMKDLRRRFTDVTAGYESWVLRESGSSMAEVAEHVRDFIEEHYAPAFADWPQKPELGLIVAGYSAEAGLAEEYQIDVIGGEVRAPRLLREPGETGATWGGETEAISRLLLGYSPRVVEVLRSIGGIDADRLDDVMAQLRQHLAAPLVQPAMPIQDAIDLATFFVDLTIQFSRFSIGAPTVGGPIEVAVITRHEGFKWVRRKHYYDAALNPGGVQHD